MKERMSKFELLKEITVVNFMVEDLSLYLNTHPSDREALIKYNAFIKEGTMLKEEYEKCYGMIGEHDSYSPYPWQWIKEPWPWEYEANFKL